MKGSHLICDERRKIHQIIQMVEHVVRLKHLLHLLHRSTDFHRDFRFACEDHLKNVARLRVEQMAATRALNGDTNYV
jgi:hypothetical protein